MPVTAITGGTVVTVDQTRRVLTPGTVLIEGEHISAVGPADQIVVPPDATVIDAAEMAVLPGLINAHTHAPAILLRGTAASQDRSLFDWLINVLYPGLAAFDIDDLKTAITLYSLEALRSGTTSVVDNQDGFPDHTFEAGSASIDVYSAAGMRAFYAPMMFDQSSDSRDAFVASIAAKEPSVNHANFVRPTEQLLRDLERLMRAYNGSFEGRIQVWPAPSHPSTASETVIRASQQLALEHGTMWTMHMANAESTPAGGAPTSTQLLSSGNMLDSRLLASHCTNLDTEDVGLLRAADVKVSVQAVSSSYLAMGMTPLMNLLDQGVTVGMGTDDANCNDSVNLLSDMKIMTLLWRALESNPSAISPEKAIEMATIDGAHAIGMGQHIGSIEVGKLADIITVDLRHAQTTPSHHVATTIVFGTYGGEVDTAIINGEVVMRHRKVRFLSQEQEDSLYDEASARSSDIHARSGVRSSRAWSR
jgi:atrazine chlorohydrolase/5-methylthioadenosine/S-adenosylhomocysteine deaminase/melamine deaminase